MRPASTSVDALDMICESHLEHRETLAALDAVAAADRPSADECRRLAAALSDNLRLHMNEEEQDLFPLLRRRAAPEDGLAETLARLSTEHAALSRAGDAAVAALAALAEAPTDADRAAVAAYVAAKRRHVMFENAVILPLARARLSPADRRALARRMAARRGICLIGDRPTETAHA
jgi:hemerythrin-like domain-containing protein